MRRSEDLLALARHVAAAQGVTPEYTHAEWLAFGQACRDALAQGRAVPSIRTAPRPAPPPVQQRRAGDPWAGDIGLLPATGLAWAGGDHGSQSPAPVPRGGIPAPARIAWGLLWRYGVLAAVLTWSELHTGPPWLLLLAVVAVGLVARLHRRHWVLARLWRALVVSAGAVFVGPMVPAAYPDVLVGSLSALTAAPLLAAWRRRR